MRPADQLLGTAPAEGAELLGTGGLLSQVTTSPASAPPPRLSGGFRPPSSSAMAR
jgi:hypothetical protein